MSALNGFHLVKCFLVQQAQHMRGVCVYAIVAYAKWNHESRVHNHRCGGHSRPHGIQTASWSHLECLPKSDDEI